MSDPVISAIIPAYRANHDFLKEAVHSVLGQTYQKWELILVEDACPDHCVTKTLGQIHSKTHDVKAWRLKENRGVSYARNFGASMAKGRFLCFLDQDDLLAPTFMETTHAVLQQYDHIDVIRVTPQFPIEIDPIRHDALTNSLMTTSLMPKEVLIKCGGWPTDPIFYQTPYAGEDICLKHCIEVAFTLKTITSPLYFHRCGHGNHTDRFLQRSKVVDGQIVMTKGTDWDQKLAEFITEKCQIVKENLKNESALNLFELEVPFQEICF